MVKIHPYPSLIPGILQRRYKRFLADVRLRDGALVTVFTPNSGSMKGCSEPGLKVMLSRAPEGSRKTRFNLEMVNSGGTWVGVNTLLANSLAAAFIDMGLASGTALEGFRVTRREVAYGESRLDLEVSDGRTNGYVEVKNVTYREGDAALFPDAVTDRGARHLDALVRARASGLVACNIFAVQRSDCRLFSPAWAIDPAYSRTLLKAREAGVVILALHLHVTPGAVFFRGTLPLEAGGL
ncbi:MAG: DNA/RNA nuclease SfsA [bacterium]|nr:MAG: DNA/RNA nuclease SfsA [bacterium]